MLDMTLIQTGKFKVNIENHDIVFVTKSILESVSLYSNRKCLYPIFQSKIMEGIIALDEEKYERIFLNLISNAIKFTPQGKRIWVKISAEEEFICIKVKDEGIGIPKDKQSIVFERFGQVDTSLSRQAEGTGIGLCLVKLLVETLGGSISLKSKEGVGSTFTVLLPNVKTHETVEKEPLLITSDSRLIDAINVEFSDIYLWSVLH